MAAALVDKATSDLLIGPDWGMNLEICDFVNADPGQAREVVKAVKKRLNNKSPTVQLLALTVLETLMKNCGELVHQNVAEKEVLPEMVKIVKKKSDMGVRDKILVLLDSWQEAFGGISSRYPQYYMAYDDLRHAGVEFPERMAETAVPMFTPPPTHSPPSYQQHPGHGPYPPPPNQHPSYYGVQSVPYQHPTNGSHQHPSYGSVPYPPPRLDAVMAANDAPVWGTQDMDAARSGVEVLNEMLSAIDLHDRQQALKDEVIVQLVEQCRSYQKNILHLVDTSSDETLLFQGLSLNDELQRALAKHDAMISGSPIPCEPRRTSPSKAFSAYDQEEEDVEDDFSQLAYRQRSRSGEEAKGSKETRPPSATQFTLPPPPQPIRGIITRVDVQGRPLDLLSDESIKDMSPTTLGAPLPDAHPLSQQPTSLLDQLNPFVDSPRFVATPSPQAQQQPMPPATTGVLPHQQYESNPLYSQQEGLQQQDGRDSSNQQLNLPKSRGGPQQLQGVQTSPAGTWDTLNTLPTLPPPPMHGSERRRFFQVQGNSNNMGSLEHHTVNLSLQDVTSPSPSSSNAPPSKGANPADHWFEDLVDFSSVSANFKKAGLTGSLSRPNMSKTSGT